MATNYPINPRVRALGKARIDIARRAQSATDWQKLWKPPAHPFPFTWGERWKQCVEYRVDDFAVEVGFFVDILGLPVNALDPGYAMFTSPQADFFIAVVPAAEGTSTPPEAIRLQFMVADIFATVEELENRGVVFEQQPQPVGHAAALHIATFLSPHGICIDLWGEIPSRRPSLSAFEKDEDIFLPGDEDDDDLSLFTTQDAAPLRAPLYTQHPASPPLRPGIQPPAASAEALDEDLEDDLDDDEELDELLKDADKLSSDGDADDDELTYEDIEPA